MAVKDKTVVITGASRGIGAAAARVFAREGARVALLARGTKEITALAEEIGDRARAIACNVADYTEVEGAIQEATSALGPVGILINNAGVIEPVSHLAESVPEEWGRVIDINLKGVYHGMRAVLPDMIKSGAGTILTISSGAAHGPVEAWSHYCASKAGAAMLTRMLEKEYGSSGIRAMGLSPGTVATQMQKEIKATGINPVSQLDWSDHIPPEWPAEALLWMCSGDADEFVGEEISLRDDDIRRRIGLIS